MFRADMIRYKGGDGTSGDDWQGILENFASTPSELKSRINYHLKEIRRSTGLDWDIVPDKDTYLNVYSFDIRNSVTDDWFWVVIMPEIIPR